MATRPISELFAAGAEANRACRLRRGNVVELPAEGDVVITGDLHGHRRNFERIQHAAALEDHPGRHVILHEIIHGGPQSPQGGCLSYELLAEAIAWKLRFPDQVHLVLSNHDTAYITSSEVMKDGREMNRALDLALTEAFGPQAPQAQQALKDYLLSQPLVVRLPHGVWFSHSLPSDRLADRFDPEILSRPLAVEDCVKPGPAYVLTWGRRMSQALLDRLAETFGVGLFVVGHQPQPDGWGRGGDNLLILASDHNHGVLLPLALDRPYDLAQACERIVPLSSIA